MASCEFLKRRGAETLPATGAWTSVFTAGSEGDAFRLVHLRSLEPAPWEARLRWSTGDESGLEALVTVPQQVRVGLYGATLQVDGRSITGATNRVAVHAPVGFARTANQWEVRGSQTASEEAVDIPPWAVGVRLDLGVDTAYATSYLRLVGPDALNTRALVYGDVQPGAGTLRMGGTRVLKVFATAQWRIVFDLSL